MSTSALAMQESTSRFNFSQEYAHQSELHGMEGRPWTFGEGVHHGPQWALLVFSQPVTAPAVGLPVSFVILYATSSCAHLQGLLPVVSAQVS